MVILLDTSVWADYLRRADSTARVEVRRLLAERRDEIVNADPVAMELLAGARHEQDLRDMNELVRAFPGLSTDGVHDFTAAAEIYRRLRWTGHTVRSQVDCLIAAIAVRHDVTLWHKDADFAAIARVVPLDHLDLR